MTKELELPELPTPVNATYTDDGKHRAPWPPGTHFYTADQMRAYALATLAKTQEGDVPLALLDSIFEEEIKRISTVEFNSNSICRKFYGELRQRLTAQQKAPEGEGVVLCCECGKPTMHMGTLCFHCSKPDSAAPGGDVEQRARQLLAAEHRRADRYIEAHLIEIGDVTALGQISINAIIAALSAPKQVGVVPKGWVLVPHKMHLDADALAALEFTCGGPRMIQSTQDGDRWLDGTVWIGDIEDDDGTKRHGLHVSCDDCPEEGSTTLVEFPATDIVVSPQAAPVPLDRSTWRLHDRIEFALRDGGFTEAEAAEMTARLEPEVPVEGEAVLWVHPGEIEAARRVKETLNGDGCVVASVFQRKDYVSLYCAPPPSQPAVELEALNRLASDINVTSDDWTARHAPGWAVMQDLANQINALIDGAKAGREKGG